MYNILERALTHEELKKIVDKDGYIQAIIKVDLFDVIKTDAEGFLDMLSEQLIGSVLLREINYNIVGSLGKKHILLEVTGNVLEFLDN